MSIVSHSIHRINRLQMFFSEATGIELPTIDSEGQYDVILRALFVIRPRNYEFLCLPMKDYDVSVLKIMY
jgi:hypothetical protein